ncbi:MAG: aspartate-semialdehyde dehydrogenase [Candidatus Eiseniibacteriota bacterium]
MNPNVVVLGATGAVGGEMVRVLEQRGFPVGSLRLLSTQRSAGRQISFRGTPHEVEEVGPRSFDGIDLALFAAGADGSRTWAPVARAAGATVVDNSNAFRYEADVPLVVPEVNRDALEGHTGLIANPNCSTIQLVLVLAPLARAVPIERVLVSTYQSVSGTGVDAITELDAQLAARVRGDGGVPAPQIYPHPIADNVLPHVDDFLDNGYCREEMKLVWESRKILGLPDLRLSATTVRVPVRVAHSEAVTIDFARPVSPAEARALLAEAPGVQVVDEPSRAEYPTPLEAAGGDLALVGRIRNDLSNERGLLLFISCDNLRKGAALNAVQIAEELFCRSLRA